MYHNMGTSTVHSISLKTKGCSKRVAIGEQEVSPTYQIRIMILLEVPFFGMFSPINGERCSAAPKA